MHQSSGHKLEWCCAEFRLPAARQIKLPDCLIITTPPHLIFRIWQQDKLKMDTKRRAQMYSRDNSSSKHTCRSILKGKINIELEVGVCMNVFLKGTELTVFRCRFCNDKY